MIREKTYFNFLEFLATRYSAIPSNTVCLKDIKDFLSDCQAAECVYDATIDDLLTEDAKDFLAHYKNTHYDSRTRSYTVRMVMCDKCGNMHYLTVYVDGRYELFDDHGNEITIKNSNWLPERIKSKEDAREVIFFYENQGK